MSLGDERLLACAALVAAAVADILGTANGSQTVIAELLHDARIQSKDFTLLGLGSVDLMRLAARLEDETGTELDDDVLIDPRRRCVLGWAECLYASGALESPSPSRHR